MPLKNAVMRSGDHPANSFMSTGTATWNWTTPSVGVAKAVVTTPLGPGAATSFVSVGAAPRA